MKTPLSRRIFFWTLFVSYFVTTGLVLFFVFGYRHDSVRNIFIHTGSLTLKTNPQEISILLNNKKPNSRFINIINDSYLITGLRPINYNLQVTKEDFKTWNKNINIHSGISTEFWNIALIRKFYDKTTYNINNIDKFFPAPNENIFAMTRQLGETLIVNVFNTKNNISTNAFVLTNTFFTKNKYENIEWSPNSKELIIPIIDTNNNKDYIIAYTKNDTTFILSKLLNKAELHAVRWDPETKDAIYLISNKQLIRIQLQNKQKIIKNTIKENVLAYDFADDGLYILTTEGALLYGGDKKEGKDLKEIIKFTVDKTHAKYRLIAYDNHRIILLNDSDRTLFIYNKGDKNIYNNKKLGSNIIGAHFSDDGKKLLFYSPFEIFVYFTRDWDTQPIRFENQLMSIIRFSQNINNVHFSKDYEHIIFSTGTEMKIVELDHRGDRQIETITTTSKPTTVISKHKMNKIFFIDSTTRHFTSINFPEKNNFLPQL